MSEPTIRKARYAKHPNDEIAGVSHFRQSLETTAIQDPGGAALPGRALTAKTKSRLYVEIYSRSVVAALALIGRAKANCVIGYVAGDGTNRKRTYKGVVWISVLSALDIAARDEPPAKPPVIGIRGVCTTSTPADTLAQMVVDATDV